MNVVVIDSQGVLRQGQAAQARDYLFRALDKFGSRILGATMHVSYDQDCGEIICTVNANVQGVGVVSVRRTQPSSDDAIFAATDAIENKVAFKVDWKAWLNLDKFATYSHSLFETVTSGLIQTGLPTDKRKKPA